MKISNIKIGPRLLIAFGLLTLISILTDILATQKLATIENGLGRIVITRSITLPMNRAIGAAEGVAEGDPTVPLTADGRGESARLVLALITMQAKLNQMVSGVRSNAEGLATASEQIAQGNQDLSAPTEQQASALEQTAASMEELSATVQSNADCAKEANPLAMAASAVAVLGGVVVAPVVDKAGATMTEVVNSIQKVTLLTGDISAPSLQARQALA